MLGGAGTKDTGLTPSPSSSPPPPAFLTRPSSLYKAEAWQVMGRVARVLWAEAMGLMQCSSHAPYSCASQPQRSLAAVSPGTRESSRIPRWTQRLLITKTNTKQSRSPWRVQSSCLRLAPTRIPRALAALSPVRSKYSLLTFNLNIQSGPGPRADRPQGPARKS